MFDLEVKMTIKTLAQKGVAKRAIARQLKLSEGTVRYHLKRMETDAVDDRSRQRQSAEAVAEAIAYWRGSATRAAYGRRIKSSSFDWSWSKMT